MLFRWADRGWGGPCSSDDWLGVELKGENHDEYRMARRDAVSVSVSAALQRYIR